MIELTPVQSIIPDDGVLREIEATAVLLAEGAGGILSGHFGRQISIEYKDKEQRDPVTEVDKACQEYLVREIGRIHPEHSILGEESSGEESEEADKPCGDFLWVLDPLDGTTNFLNGLPVYASSIGVLYRGRLVAGALFIPWPTEGGGFVLHCRRGAGCFAGEERVGVHESEEIVNNRLVGLPGFFGMGARFGPGMKGRTGEVRTTGSIAYELAMTACGVLQYAVIGGPRMWDMAAGALAVSEAGGAVMTRLRGQKKWGQMDSLVPSWNEKPPTLKELRQWVAPLVAGNQHVAPLVANNLQTRFRPLVSVRRKYRQLHSRWARKPPQKS
jgi:myo-inositol-1(or 4)-monophosphatase